MQNSKKRKNSSDWEKLQSITGVSVQSRESSSTLLSCSDIALTWGFAIHPVACLLKSLDPVAQDDPHVFIFGFSYPVGQRCLQANAGQAITVCKSHWVLNTFNLIVFLTSATTNNRSSSQKPKLNFWLHQILNFAALPADPSSSFSLQQSRLKLIGKGQTRSLRHSSPWS